MCIHTYIHIHTNTHVYIYTYMERLPHHLLGRRLERVRRENRSIGTTHRAVVCSRQACPLTPPLPAPASLPSVHCGAPGLPLTNLLLLELSSFPLRVASWGARPVTCDLRQAPSTAEHHARPSKMETPRPGAHTQREVDKSATSHRAVSGECHDRGSHAAIGDTEGISNPALRFPVREKRQRNFLKKMMLNFSSEEGVRVSQEDH